MEKQLTDESWNNTIRYSKSATQMLRLSRNNVIHSYASRETDLLQATATSKNWYERAHRTCLSTMHGHKKGKILTGVRRSVSSITDWDERVVRVDSREHVQRTRYLD